MTKDQLNDPYWRLCNLYHIVDKSGNDVLFQPNEAQKLLLDDLANNNVILKARQLGYSTLIQLLMLDQCVFVANTHAGVIAQDEYAASKIFSDKIKYAWDHLPDWVHDNIKAIGDSTRELELDNGSRISVATSMRSTTLQYLHVSEMGKICAKSPGKAKEIITGSLPAVSDTGFVFVESTAEGREGYFYDLVQSALARKHLSHNKRDFRLHFAPWYMAPEYAQEHPESLTQEDNDYFDALQAQQHITITQQQRWWYVATKRTKMLGDGQKMKQEYPSTPEEAFSRSTEGTWFINQFTLLRSTDRIVNVPHVKGYPVHTCWDIGRSDGTAIWCFQHIGIDYRFIRFIEDWDKEYDHYVAELNRYGYVFGTHYLPHDAGHRRQAKTAAQSKTAEQMLKDLGLSNTKVCPRTPQKILSINNARAKLPQCYFDKTNCASGLLHLESYSKHWDTVHAQWTDVPEHNRHSEASDAFQVFADWYKPTTQANTGTMTVNRPQTSPFK